MKKPMIYFFPTAAILLFVTIMYTDATCSSTCTCGKDEVGSYGEEKLGIRQCTYKNLGDGRDDGEIMTCDFKKTHSNTALRVTYHGDMRVISGSDVCRRWFITINGKECTSPDTIEAAIHPIGVTGLNNHRHGTLDGFCENIPKGRIIVGLSVGNCKYGYENRKGDAFTCWGGVCRLIIEEVPPLK